MNQSDVSLSRKVKFFQLAVFDQIVATGSLVKAAAALNLTQPSVTKIVQELEYYFKAPLLIRSHRGIAVTELGALVSHRSRSILAGVRKLHDDVEASQRGMLGRVSVGTLESESASILPGVLDLLRERAPKLIVSVRQGQMNHLSTQLKAAELDIVVGRIPDNWKWHPDATELTAVPLYREEFCIVAGMNHVLQAGGPPTWSQLHEFQWLLPPRDTPLRQHADNLLSRVGMPRPSKIVESNSLLETMGILQNNSTLALTVKGAINPYLQGGKLRIIDAGEALNYGEVGYFLPANREPARALHLLIQCLNESTRHIDGPVGAQNADSIAPSELAADWRAPPLISPSQARQIAVR
ncbi:LysR substrate-binding domain-containing protein [Achromobacter deleyi]|uniref:LysR substrate-binding domain-containing protein n=1 Tax=Achromobacter deleyi TaxID=1353891 RepID=UPI001492BB9B|nr:LysR substrate-binding domain-containing protein [Achromobacter deleyi]QVQ28306.1 LysR family transcriptional regulator [Achromobacter deleyi]